jgi:hypothetical protein
MATVSVATFSAVLNVIFGDTLANQYNTAYPILNLFDVEQGANSVNLWPVKFRTRTAGGAYAEGADMASGDYDSNTPLQASHPYAQYRKGARVSGLAQAVSKASGGLALNVDVVQNEIQDAVDSMFLDLSTHLYSGNVGASPAQLAGIAAGIDSSTAAPYAGIDPATYTDWKSAEATIAAASLNIANIRTYLLNPVQDATGTNPDMVLCDRVFFDRVKILADQSGDAPMMYIGGQRRILRDLGVNAVTVDGVPFIYDRFATANTAYGVTRKDIKLVQVPDAAQLYTQDPAQAAANARVIAGVMGELLSHTMQVSEAEIAQMLMAQANRLQPALVEIAKAGDADNFMVKIYMQLKYKRRNSHAKLVLT